MNIVRGFPEHEAYWKKTLSHYDFIFLTNNLKARGFLFCFVFSSFLFSSFPVWFVFSEKKNQPRQLAIGKKTPKRVEAIDT